MAEAEAEAAAAAAAGAATAPGAAAGVRSSLTKRHLTEKWVGFLTERRLTELQFQKRC